MVAVVLDIVVIVIVVLILMSYSTDSNLAFQQATMLLSVQAVGGDVFSSSPQCAICCNQPLASC